MNAVLSPCGAYRYRLERSVSLLGDTAAVVMVNPSTADAHVDDPTIRRVIGFAKRLQWARILVGNVFAFRATEVRDLAYAADPHGPENSAYLEAILEEADLALFAWGPVAKLPKHLRESWRSVWDASLKVGLPVRCLGTAKDGHPRHPLMLSYSARLVSWVPPSE
ncbi:MAG: DUF1643 domain-containing protein [Pseudomonadota bacterium]|nr:DUF1643 domain-containing protein [Pseudomonadota bacterium]